MLSPRCSRCSRNALKILSKYPQATLMPDNLSQPETSNVQLRAYSTNIATPLAALWGRRDSGSAGAAALGPLTWSCREGVELAFAVSRLDSLQTRQLAGRSTIGIIAIMSSVTTHPPETTSGTITSWLPLTSAADLQAGCSSAIQWRSGFAEAVAFDPGFGITVDRFARCQPEQVTSWWETNEAALTALRVTTRYSIGPIACPEAYTTASTRVKNKSSTEVFCCPSYVPASGDASPTDAAAGTMHSVGACWRYV